MSVPALPRHNLPTWIDGHEVRGDERMLVRYPYTGDTIGSAPRLSRDVVTRVLDRAAARRFDLSDR